MRGDRLRPLLLVPVVLLAMGEISLAQAPPFAEAPLDYLFDAVAGVSLVVAGLIVWSRRPGALTGPLIVLAGYLWYVGSLYILFPVDSALPLVGSIAFLGFAFRGYYDLILAFVVLTFPGQRLETRTEKALVITLLALMVARTVWRLIGVQPGVGTGNAPAAPANPFLLIKDVPTFVDGDVFLSTVMSVVLIGIAIAAIRRRGRIRPGARRVTDPVLLGGALWAGLAGLYGLSGFIHETVGLDIVPYDGPGWTAQYLLRLLGPLGLLLGAVRLRGSTAAAIALMAGPDGPPRGADLERTLRQTLDDPTLELLEARGGGWLDTAGRAAVVPASGGDRATTLLERDGAKIGAIVHDVTLLDDPALIRTVAAGVALTVDNQRLQQELLAQLEEVRASRARIVEAGDAERRRVERDLHDGAQQRLVALAVSLRTIRSRLGADLTPPVDEELKAASDLVRLAIAEVRELARGLDPSILREAGIEAAIRSLADHSAILVRVSIDLDGRLPARTETAAYFVAAEALANAAKHSSASVVTVTASQADGILSLDVVDDGVGGADVDGSGIRGLADRIAAVGGTLVVASAAGAGTRVHAAIPCVS